MKPYIILISFCYLINIAASEEKSSFFMRSYMHSIPGNYRSKNEVNEDLIREQYINCKNRSYYLGFVIDGHNFNQRWGSNLSDWSSIDFCDQLISQFKKKLDTTPPLSLKRIASALTGIIFFAEWNSCYRGSMKGLTQDDKSSSYKKMVTDTFKIHLACGFTLSGVLIDLALKKMLTFSIGDSPIIAKSIAQVANSSKNGKSGLCINKDKYNYKVIGGQNEPISWEKWKKKWEKKLNTDSVKNLKNNPLMQSSFVTDWYNLRTHRIPCFFPNFKSNFILKQRGYPFKKSFKKYREQFVRSKKDFNFDLLLNNIPTIQYLNTGAPSRIKQLNSSIYSLSTIQWIALTTDGFSDRFASTKDTFLHYKLGSSCELEQKAREALKKTCSVFDKLQKTSNQAKQNTIIEESYKIHPPAIDDSSFIFIAFKQS